MPLDLSPEEFESQFGGGQRAAAPQAGRGTLFGSAVDRTQAALIGLGEAAGLPFEDWRRAQQFEAEQSARRYYETNPQAIQSFRDISGVGGAGSYLADLAVQSAPALVGIGAAGLAGGPMGAFAAGSAMGTGEILQGQREQAGATNLSTAVPLGLVYGGAEALTGLGGAVARRSLSTGVRALDDAGRAALDAMPGFGGAAARTGAAFARTGLSESAGEVLQDFTVNAGRLAVDPNVTLFGPQEMEGYLESAVGGFALGGLVGGGLGGWRRSAQYQPPEREKDLTGQEAPVVETQQYGLTTEMAPIQQRINEQLGIGRKRQKDYASQFASAFNEPSGQYGVDQETGVERELTMGELVQLQNPAMDLTQAEPAKAATANTLAATAERDPRAQTLRDTFGVLPTPSAMALLAEVEASGIPADSDLVAGVWAYAAEKPMNLKRLDKARLMLDSAIIESRKGAANVSPAVAPTGPVAAGVGTGGAVAPASVAAGGPVSQQPVGPVAGVPAAPSAAPAAPVVTGAVSQPATTVVPAAPAAPETRFRRAPRPMTILEAANAAKAAQAQQTETQGQEAPAATGPVADERETILKKIFGDRNGQIIFDVVGMGMPEPEAAAKYGLSRSAIQKIAGATGADERAGRVKAARASGRVTQAEIDTAFKPAAAAQQGTIAAEVFGGPRNMFTIGAEGVSTTEAEAEGLIDLEAGDVGVKTVGAGKGAVEGFSKLEKDTMDVLEAMAAETDPEELAKLNEKLTALTAKVAALEKGAQEEVRRAAGKQKTKTTVEGEEDAVQEQGAAEVSVQPEAEAGQGVGGKVRRAKKPAAEGQVPAAVLTEAEQAAQAWDKVAAEYPTAPKFADLTKEQQETFVEYGPEFWTKEDVETELTKLAKQPAQRYDYPTPPPGAPAYVQPAQRAVVDFMNGDVTKQQLLERFAKLGMTEGQIRSVTNRIDITKDEIDSVSEMKTVLGFARQSRRTARLFTTDLYLGKENVPGQPQYGRELRNPVTLNDGTRLDGFTSRDQSVFSGYDRNGQRVSVPQDSVSPSDIKSSRDSNRTANALKAALSANERQSRSSVRATDQDGVDFESVEASLEDLSGYSEGIAAGISNLRSSGMGNAVDAIDSWMVTFSPVSWDAIYTMMDGKRTIIYNGMILKDKQLAAVATMHEVGHGVDEVQAGVGKFSGGKEFKVSRVNGELMALRPGTAMDEILNHFEDSSETSPLGVLLNYPLDMADANNRSLSIQELREEVFAQVWAFSNMNGGMEYLRDNLPTTHAFMEKVHEQVKATSYATTQGAQQGAQPGQVQAGQQGTQPAGAISRASRQAKQGLIDSTVNKLPEQLRQPVKNSVGAISDLGGGYLDRVLFTNSLVNRAEKAGMTAARKWANAMASSKSAANASEREIEKIADMYATIEEDFKGSGPGSVNEFLFESTRQGKWGYGKYRDAAVGAQFDALGPKAQAFVKAVFAHGDKMLSEKKKVVLDSATSEYDAAIKAAQIMGDPKEVARLKKEKADNLKRFQTLFRIREGLPYAPIKRSGDWVVVGRSNEYMQALEANDTAKLRELEQNPDHYQVSFVDSKAQARTLQAEMEAGASGMSVAVSKRATAMDDYTGQALLPALTALRAKVDKDGGKASSRMLSMISQLYLDALAEDSARKSEMRRRGISGQVDMLSSFTTQGRADANFMASVKYSPEIQDALQQMRRQSKQGDVTRRSEIFDELSKRYIESLDYSVNPWINKLTGVASKYFLATSPGYYIQNLTQPFMMSVPAMAGKHDYAKVGQELWKAYSELGPLFKNTKLFDQQFDFSQVPDDVKAAVDELVKRGKIDIGLATEINEYKVDADNKLSKFAQRLNKGMRLAVQKTEAINRLSTAMAAYRLELARTNDKQAAIAYADRILTETHGDYTAFNAPRIFNNNFGKVALQFRKFQLVQIAFYAKLIGDAFNNPAERKAALRTLGYSLAHTGVFAGAMGLPGYAAVAALAGMLFGDEDEPFDLTEEMRKALGPDWSQLVMRGAPTLAGVDLSGKIGAGNMLAVAPFADIDLTTQAGVAQAIGTVAGGAAGGMTARMLDGLGLMANGDWYRGLEQTMPKGISDMLKAGRISGEGVTRRNGDVILPDSEVSAVGQVFAAMGLPSSQVAETYQAMQYSKDLEKNFTERATKVKNQYAKAYRNKDSEAMAEARQAWTNLQAARKRNDLKPQPMSSLLRAPQEQGKREKKLAEQID